MVFDVFCDLHSTLLLIHLLMKAWHCLCHLFRFHIQILLLFKLPWVLFRRCALLNLTWNILQSVAQYLFSQCSCLFQDYTRQVLPFVLIWVFWTLQGLRPTIPKNINPKLAELLQKCWKSDPSERPEFSETTTMLQQILKEVCSETETDERHSSLPNGGTLALYNLW